MKSIFILLIFLFPSISYADDTYPSVKESYFEWRKFDIYKNPYLPEVKYWDYIGESHTNLSLTKDLYWITNLHLAADGKQVRYAGLEYTLGYQLSSYMDIIKYHHSQHALDKDVQMHYPLEESYGFRLYFKK